MRLTLDNIVAKFKHPPAQRPAEPTFTLELTGPGIFTDSVKACDDAVAMAKASSAIASVGRPGGGRGAWPQLRVTSVDHLAQMGHLLEGEYLAGAGAMMHISRLAGNRYFTHMGQGSWKLWRHHSAELDGTSHHSAWLRRRMANYPPPSSLGGARPRRLPPPRGAPGGPGRLDTPIWRSRAI